MSPARIQVARFSSDRCREIEAALILSGYLRGKPSTLELQYRHGGVWRVKTNSERAVIAVSASPVDNSQWVLEIQPQAPIPPKVIYRTPPSAAQMKQFEQVCYDVAVVIHQALLPRCPELQWEMETDQGTLTFSGAPIPPVA